MVIERGLQPSEVRLTYILKLLLSYYTCVIVPGLYMFYLCVLQIKSLVASPGGTTIHGLKVMEDCGVRSGIMGAVQRATERAIELRPKQS